MTEDRAYTILTALRNIKLSISDEMNEQLKPWFDDIEKAIEGEPTDENLHREREQAYMQGYEDASKRFRQEPCDDTISREAALKECHDIVVEGERYRVIQEETLLGLPPVTQKSGKWIRDTITDLYHCSECRSICHQDPKSKDDYCRYCGAKMESEDKE